MSGLRKIKIVSISYVFQEREGGDGDGAGGGEERVRDEELRAGVGGGAADGGGQGGRPERQGHQRAGENMMIEVPLAELDFILRKAHLRRTQIGPGRTV